MSQNEIGMWHSLGGAPFNVGTCFFGRQKRRATTLKGASVCNYVLKLILTRDVRFFGRDVDVIVGGRHCFCHHRLKASTDVRTDVQKDIWKDVRKDVRMRVRTDVCTDVCMDVWTDVRADVFTHRRADGRTSGRTSGQTSVRTSGRTRVGVGVPGGRGAGRGGGGAPGGHGAGRGGGGAPGGCRLDAEDAERLEDVKRDAGDAGRLEDAELDAEEAERLEDADFLLPCVSSFVALLSSFLRGGSVDAPWRLAPRSLDGSSAEAGSAEVPRRTRWPSFTHAGSVEAGPMDPRSASVLKENDNHPRKNPVHMEISIISSAGACARPAGSLSAAAV